MSFIIEIDDNSEEVLNALENAIDRGLKVIGDKAVDYARDKCPHKTGTLAGSITSVIEDKDCYIGTNCEYAPYVEFGTGIYGTMGGRGTPWVYQDANGNWWTTRGQHPQPYLKPAATEHSSEYGQLLKASLENA